MIRTRNIRHPRDRDDAALLRELAGKMMEHHLRAPWWDLRQKFATYVAARAYASRSSERIV